jgi:hypothetical protein
MKIKLFTLAMCFYIIPAMLSPAIVPYLGGVVSKEAYYTISISVIAVFLGFLVHLYMKRKILIFTGREYSLLLSVLAKALIFIGVGAFLIGVVNVGGFPLFTGNVFRVKLYNSPYWSLFVLAQVGVFLIAWLKCHNSNIVISSFYVVVVILCALLSGGKGPLLLTLIFYYATRFKLSNIKASKVIIAGLIFLALFFAINTIRTQISGISLIQVPYYIFFGFVNFSDIAYSFPGSGCFYSIPIIGCDFVFDNSLLEIKTWNVYTALMPLYIDGGNFLVFIFFFFISVVFSLSYNSRGVITLDYLFVYIFYFFMMAHNGYMFNSGVLFLMLLFFLSLDVFKGCLGRENA